ncbi:MAG: hypothetical protein ACRDQ5_08260 [Sciscionella sp.]
MSHPTVPRTSREDVASAGGDTLAGSPGGRTHGPGNRRATPEDLP